MTRPLSENVAVVGTCLSMCPEAETRIRENNKLLHRYEIEAGTESEKLPRADRIRIVKKYSRPAAGKLDLLPSELRPAPVLLHSVLYLVENICAKGDQPWAKIYEFVFDRLRAVRQDMVIQDLKNEIVVYILQCAVRFHILSAYKLCLAPPADYDEKINNTHIQECLKRLLCLYSRDSNCTRSCCCLQGEFLALYLLFNLGAPDALQLAFEQKSVVSRDVDFALACKISIAWNNKNYVRVFKLANRISPLAQCVLNLHLNKIRREAVKIMSSGYNSKNLTFPLSDLTEILHLGTEERSRELCEFYGLELNTSSVKFIKSSFKDDVLHCVEKEEWIESRVSKIPVVRLLKGHTCKCMEAYMHHR